MPLNIMLADVDVKLFDVEYFSDKRKGQRCRMQSYRASLACIYIYLYGYTNGLAGIVAAVGQADMYLLIYICGYLPICRPTSHPEYTLTRFENATVYVMAGFH